MYYEVEPVDDLVSMTACKVCDIMIESNLMSYVLTYKLIYYALLLCRLWNDAVSEEIEAAFAAYKRNHAGNTTL